MSDYERYGDYDDIEEDSPKSKNPVVIILKVLVAVVCIGVVGLIAFRLIAFNSYPANVKNIYFNDKLTAYYESVDGNIGAKTQKLRAPYDDPDLGNFFCDHLIVIEDADQLQITVRYNKGNVGRISEGLGVELDIDDPEIFKYRLVDNYGRVYSDIGGTQFASRLMYRYNKLVFDNVDLTPEEGNAPEWIRLEIFVRGTSEDEPYSMVPIYENNADFSDFSDYELSEKEKP